MGRKKCVKFPWCEAVRIAVWLEHWHCKRGIWVPCRPLLPKTDISFASQCHDVYWQSTQSTFNNSNFIIHTHKKKHNPSILWRYSCSFIRAHHFFIDFELLILPEATVRDEMAIKRAWQKPIKGSKCKGLMYLWSSGKSRRLLNIFYWTLFGKLCPKIKYFVNVYFFYQGQSYNTAYWIRVHNLCLRISLVLRNFLNLEFTRLLIG